MKNIVLKKLEEHRSKKTVCYYIKNPVYGGLQWKTKDDIKSIFCEDPKTNQLIVNEDKKLKQLSNVTPIIDEEVWYRAITKWMSNYTKPNYTRYIYVFSETAYCNECNELLETRNGIYKCKNKKSKVDKKILERTILRKIIKDISNKDYVSGYIKLEKDHLKSEISIIQKKLTKVKKEKQNLLLYNLSDLNNSHFLSELDRKVHEENSLNQKLISYERRLYNLNDFPSQIKNFISINDNTKKTIEFLLSNESNLKREIDKIVDKVFVSIRNKKIIIKDVVYGSE